IAPGLRSVSQRSVTSEVERISSSPRSWPAATRCRSSYSAANSRSEACASPSRALPINSVMSANARPSAPLPDIATRLRTGQSVRPAGGPRARRMRRRCRGAPARVRWTTFRRKPSRMNGTVRLIAAIEAAKGMLALVAASGMLSLLHHDLRAIAYALVEHAHLNPAARYPAIFVRAAEHLQDANLQLVAAGAAAYALLRLVEAWGLWRGRGWAELLAAASGAIYLPFEAFG